MATEQRVGDDQAEHGVAEELQALVGGQATVLVRERPVSECALEQIRARCYTERAFELGSVGRRMVWSHAATSMSAAVINMRALGSRCSSAEVSAGARRTPGRFRRPPRPRGVFTAGRPGG